MKQVCNANQDKLGLLICTPSPLENNVIIREVAMRTKRLSKTHPRR
jgi:hypothetical protein